MECKICGSEIKVTYRYSKYQALCDLCNKETPRKMSRREFDGKYWTNEELLVPEFIKKEFYSDYLGSTETFHQYKRSTSEKYE